MFYLIQVLYITFLLPPGIFFVLLAIFTLWLKNKNRKAARLLALIILPFYLMSTGLVSGTLVRSLETRYFPPAEVHGDVIVMLGGGATLDTPNINGLGHLSGHAANRLLTAAQLSGKLNAPIIVSGGKVLATTGNEAEIAKRTLILLGIPEEKIIIEDRSLNTTQNAKYTKELVDRYGYRQPILVTSAFHMERAVRQFRKAGQEVVPFPTDYQANIQNQLTVYHFLPSASALADSQLAVKEYIGLLVSKWY